MSPLHLEPGDVVCMRGERLFSRLIRFFSRSVGEPPCEVGHVGIIVQGGAPREAILVEALARVQQHPLWERYAPDHGTKVIIFRPINLTKDDIARVVAKAQTYVGKRYGVVMLAAHLLDWVLLGAYVFRRLANFDDYPICSWVVASAFKAIKKGFGCELGAAQPDNIYRFCMKHTEAYIVVHPLSLLPEQ